MNTWISGLPDVYRCLVGVKCLEVTFWGPCCLLGSCVMIQPEKDHGVWGADERARGQRGRRKKAQLMTFLPN